MPSLAQIEHDKAGRLVEQAQSLIKDNDELSAEQRKQYDNLVAAATDHLDRRDKCADQDARLKAFDQDAAIAADLLGMSQTGEAPTSMVADSKKEMANLLAAGVDASRSKSVEFDRRAFDAYRPIARAGGTAGEMVKEALSTGTANVPVPTITQAAFYEKLLAINGIHSIPGVQRVTTPDGVERNWPKANSSSTARTFETTTVSSLQTAEATAADLWDATFGEVATTPRKYAGYARISEELLADSAPNIEMKVGEMLARDLGLTLAFAYAQGRGQAANEPDGLLKISIVDDVAFSGAANVRRIQQATINTPLYSELNRVVYAIDDFGDDSAMAWHMRRDTLGAIIGLTGSDNHPLFKYSPYFGAGMSPSDAGSKSMGLLLGYPVHLAHFAGRLNQGNQILAAFGVWSQYLIHDGPSNTIRRSDHTRFLEGQVDFKVDQRTDARILNPECFSWLKEHA